MTNNPPRYLNVPSCKDEAGPPAGLLEAYRAQGYRAAALDPLTAPPPDQPPALDPARHGLDPQAPQAQRLRQLYCGPLALDASAVRDEERRRWLFERMEAEPPALGAAARLALLRRLADAEAWETLVRQRHPQAKRFSLQGCEALLPLMDALLEAAAAQGLTQLVLGMPHRGRLNLLVNLLGCPPARLLAYFDPAAEVPARDLVYHLGGQASRATAHGRLSLLLAHNPSHLQSVQPVVAGMTRARRDAGAAAAALLLHGDAAFAGQGVVMECLNLTRQPGYGIGGVVHVVINNQIGFTTPNRQDLAAPRTCTDVARMVDAPVLRVNADAPEQLARAARMAFDYRAAFAADIVIDLLGYRRLGHAEGDPSGLTQPQEQACIDRHPGIVARYGAQLQADGLLDAAALEALAEEALAAQALPQAGSDFRALDEVAPAAPAGLPALRLDELRAQLAALTTPPDGFLAHERLRQLQARWWRCLDAPAEGLAEAGGAVDWCLAENLAYASLLQAGVGLRLSGMDVGRGTFMHRQAVWHDQGEQARRWLPLQGLARAGACAEVINSPLSEEAVLGYEYGYSLLNPRRLVLWEAQYGDFVNGAQIMIDQYLASGEEKWGCRSALAVLLPHGQEGAGPEHSNGYLGRFLQLCAADNLRVVMPSDSAQWFHLLRQQATADRPLVVMTPKAQLLAEPGAHAALDRLLNDRFRPVLAEVAGPDAARVRRVVLCSGKLYHELRAARAATPAAVAVALLRLEQLYPFPAAELAAALAPFGDLQTLVWAQEEDARQGPWQFLRDELEAGLPAGVRLLNVCRPASAAGARSSVAAHRLEQQALWARALLG